MVTSFLLSNGKRKKEEANLGDRMNQLEAVRPDTSNIINITKGGMPTEHEMLVYSHMAKHALESKMYGRMELPAIMSIILAAREYGIPPMMALNGGLNIIQGKVEISARMMSGLIRQAKHSITIKESTASSCILVGRRSDTHDTATVSYTLEEARLAGLVKPGGGWIKNPKDMCFARAISRLARQLFSDVIGMGYVEGEIKATEAEVVVPDDIPEENLLKQLTEEYINLFDEEDRYLAVEYMATVKNHFGWENLQTLQELLKDPKRLADKFNSWKARKQKVEELLSST